MSTVFFFKGDYDIFCLLTFGNFPRNFLVFCLDLGRNMILFIWMNQKEAIYFESDVITFFKSSWSNSYFGFVGTIVICSFMFSCMCTTYKSWLSAWCWNLSYLIFEANYFHSLLILHFTAGLMSGMLINGHGRVY